MWPEHLQDGVSDTWPRLSTKVGLPERLGDSKVQRYAGKRPKSLRILLGLPAHSWLAVEPESTDPQQQQTVSYTVWRTSIVGVTRDRGIAGQSVADGCLSSPLMAGVITSHMWYFMLLRWLSSINMNVSVGLWMCTHDHNQGGEQWSGQKWFPVSIWNCTYWLYHSTQMHEEVSQCFVTKEIPVCY